MAVEISKYFNRVYVKVINHRTGEDITSRSTVVVLCNGAIYNTRPSPNGPNMYDILEFPYTHTSPIDVTCGATCEGYSQNGVPSKTVDNYSSSLTLTVIDIKQNMYETNIEGNITRISDAKFDIKEAINDRGGNLTDEKIDQYATAADSALKTRFNECNYDYNGVADDEGLKALGWNAIDIAYFKYNNLHAKSEDTGETYNVTAANKEIKITSLSDISKYKSNADFKFCPKFDTSKEDYTSQGFADCTYLTAIPQLDISNAIYASKMFYNCSSLISIPQLDTSKTHIMENMFYNCSSLTTIPLLNTSKVTNMGHMFYGCSSLTSIPLLNTSNVTDMSSMFSWCINLTTLGGFTGLKTNLELYSSSNLTHDSLMNVINKAADVTSSPKKLTIGSTNLGKLSDAEKKIATDKGWILS